MAYAICRRSNVPVNIEKAQDFADLALAITIHKHTSEKCSFESFLFWEVRSLVTQSVKRYYSSKHGEMWKAVSTTKISELSSCCNQERDLIIRDLLEKLYRKLKKRNKEIFELLMKGLSITEAAEELGVSQSRASQARRKIAAKAESHALY